MNRKSSVFPLEIFQIVMTCVCTSHTHPPRLSNHMSAFFESFTLKDHAKHMLTNEKNATM